MNGFWTKLMDDFFGHKPGERIATPKAVEVAKVEEAPAPATKQRKGKFRGNRVQLRSGKWVTRHEFRMILLQGAKSEKVRAA